MCHCVDAGRVQQLPQKAHKQKQAKRTRRAAVKPLDPGAAQLAALTANVEMQECKLQRARYARQKCKYGLLQKRQAVKDGCSPRSSDPEEGNGTSILPVQMMLLVTPCLLVCCRGSWNFLVLVCDNAQHSCSNLFTALAFIKLLYAAHKLASLGHSRKDAFLVSHVNWNGGNCCPCAMLQQSN